MRKLTPLYPIAEAAVLEFAKAVLHGDQEHREWLLDAAEAFAAGRPLPPARGGGLHQPDPRKRANSGGK